MKIKNTDGFIRQSVTPMMIRRKLNLDENAELTATIRDDKIIFRSLPTAAEWKALFKNVAVEDVDVDE